MVRNLNSALEGFARHHTPIPIAIFREFMFGLKNGTNKSKFHLSISQREVLSVEMKEIEERVSKEHAEKPLPIDTETFWNNLLAVDEFGLGLWKSEESAYITLYYGYEDFLTRVLGIAMNDPNYRWYRIKEFKAQFETTIGPKLKKDCLDDSAAEHGPFLSGILASA